MNPKNFSAAKSKNNPKNFRKRNILFSYFQNKSALKKKGFYFHKKGGNVDYFGEDLLLLGKLKYRRKTIKEISHLFLHQKLRKKM